jgi:hypothetical protein
VSAIEGLVSPIVSVIVSVIEVSKGPETPRRVTRVGCVARPTDLFSFSLSNARFLEEKKEVVKVGDTSDTSDTTYRPGVSDVE